MAAVLQLESRLASDIAETSLSLIVGLFVFNQCILCVFILCVFPGLLVGNSPNPAVGVPGKRERLFTGQSCPPTSGYCQSLAVRIARPEKTNGKLHPEQNKWIIKP